MPPLRYRLIRNIFTFLFRVLARLHTEGLDKLPLRGPYIMATNHIHLFDPPLVFAVLGDRYATGFVGASHQRNLFWRLLLNAVGVIWIRRGEADRAAMRAALTVLKGGRILGIAPEGTRSRSHTLIAGKEGTAFLAQRANVPIYPIGLWGTENIVPAWLRLQRADVHVVFGEAFELSAVSADERSQRLQIWTDEIMCRIASLLPQSYRGVYSDHPRLRELEAEIQNVAT